MHLNGLLLIPFFFLTRLNSVTDIISNKLDGAKKNTKKQYKRLDGWSLDISKPENKKIFLRIWLLTFGHIINYNIA